MSVPDLVVPAAPPPLVDLLPMLDLDFNLAAEQVLGHLATHLPLALWSVTRVESGRQTFLHLDPDNGYRLPQGHSLPWEDTLCVHMAAGRAPAVAPDARAVPLYATAPMNAASSVGTIGTYAGAVIHEPNGHVFGTIVGLDPAPHRGDTGLAQATGLLPLLGHLLTLVLAADRIRDHAGQSLVEASLTADTDGLTGLFSRRAWDRMILEEEQRFLRFADPTVLVMMDLDELKLVNDNLGHPAGDRFIRSAGTALRSVLRETDVVARLGGDEFGALLRGCTEAQAERAVARIHAALQEAAAPASVGWAPVRVLEGVGTAVVEADAAMYVVKTRRRDARRRLEGWPG